jgi:hypothetical protein
VLPLRAIRHFLPAFALALTISVVQPAITAHAQPEDVAHTSALSFTTCTPSQIISLTTDIQNASTMARQAYEYFTNNQAGSKYTYWFGAYTPDRWNIVRENYRLIASLFSVGNINIDCSMTNCGGSSYGYVFPTDTSPHTIYICVAYQVAPALGTDSRAGTLIHLGSQFQTTARANSYAYGQTDSHSLALSNPTRAIANSDNYEYFAENTPSIADNAAAFTTGRSSHNFQNVVIGQSSPGQQFTVTNTGDIGLTISSITTSDDFSVQSGNCTSAPIASTSTCTFTALFTPRTIGSHTASISIASNSVVSPSAIVLTGSGSPAVTATTTPIAPTTTAPTVTTLPPTNQITQIITQATTVKVSAISRASELRVLVIDTATSGQRSFKVQIRNGSRWRTLAGTYTTKSSTGVRVINLPKGTYRVVVKAKSQYEARTSSSVKLLR